VSLRGVSLSRQGKTRGFCRQGKAPEKAVQAPHFLPLPSGDGGAASCQELVWRMREAGLGLGLYFGQAVVREPQPHGVPGQFRVCTAPVAMPLVGMERRKTRPPAPVSVCSPKRCAYGKKRHFGVFRQHRRAYPAADGSPAWGWYGMTPSSVVRGQQSGVKFANEAIRALYDL
jgi:hypothetical protein